jgi:hypothetical protein
MDDARYVAITVSAPAATPDADTALGILATITSGLALDGLALTVTPFGRFTVACIVYIRVPAGSAPVSVEISLITAVVGGAGALLPPPPPQATSETRMKKVISTRDVVVIFIKTS